MKNLAYYNGRYDLMENMQIPMGDRVCWFGDGVYDAGPVRNYRIFAIDEHIDRLYRSADAVGIRIPKTKEEPKELLQELVNKMDTPDNFLYVQVTRGTAYPRSHEFTSDEPGNLWVTIKHLDMNPGLEPVKLITYEDKRWFYNDIKTLNLLPAVLSATAAARAGAAEAVFYRSADEVTECSHSNISVLKDGVLYSHPNDDKILPGIAKKYMFAACKALGIPVREEIFGIEFLMNADEIIKTSSGNICIRVSEIDGRPAGMKDPENYERIRRQIFEDYYKATED